MNIAKPTFQLPYGLFQSRWCEIALPDSDDRPTLFSEPTINLFIPSNIALDFLHPEFPIGFNSSSLSFPIVTVPKLTIKEDC